MKKIAILSLFLLSCKTIEKAELVEKWTDKWNVTYRVYKTKIYDRKTKEYLMTRTDTVVTDMYEFENRPIIQ